MNTRNDTLSSNEIDPLVAEADAALSLFCNGTWKGHYAANRFSSLIRKFMAERSASAPETPAPSSNERSEVERLRDTVEQLRQEIGRLKAESRPSRETCEQPWMVAADRLLEKIGHVPGIEHERKTLLAFMPSPPAPKAGACKHGNATGHCQHCLDAL